MKNIMYAGLAALLIVGCGSGVNDSKLPDTEEPIIDERMDSYFPMNLGDQWVYRGELMGDKAMYTVIVKGTKKVGENTYFEFERRHDAELTSRFFRVSGDKIFELVGDAERLFLDKRRLGNASNIDEYILAEDGAVVETPFGTFNGCLVYEHGKKVMDAGGSLSLAPGVGIVAFSSIYIGGVYEDMKLEEAVVRGMKLKE